MDWSDSTHSMEFLVPTYEYKCRACEEHFDVEQSFSDDPLTTLAGCAIDEFGDHQLKKVFSAVGISFRGEGFYRNDSRSGSSSSSTPASNGSSTSEGSSDSSSTSTSESSSTSEGAKSGDSSSSKSDSSASSSSDTSSKSESSSKSETKSKPASSSSS